MGVLLSMVYRGRWFSVAGVGTAIIGFLVGSASRATGEALVWTGVTLMLIQVPVSLAAERRAKDGGPPGSTGP
jgi:hypothetical protein